MSFNDVRGWPPFSRDPNGVTATGDNGHGRPNDERGILHKTFFRVVSKVAGVLPIPGASVISGIAGTLAGRDEQKQRALGVKFGNGAAFAETGRPNGGCGVGRAFDAFGRCQPIPGFGGGGTRPPCDFPMVRDAAGRCRTPTSGEFGGEQFGVGNAVMGRYGAALEPGSMIIDRAICLKGMQLGNDGLCYNKSAITNKQRMWPRGRRPLLTGGDMRAIGIAARAGSKLDRTTKRLRALGMMKALPKGRGPAPHAHAKPVAAVSVP